MPSERREFLKAAGGALGAMAVAPWVLEAEAAQAELVTRVRGSVADAVLAAARRLGASYADVRVSRYRTESIVTREQQVQGVSRGQTAGFGVRVLVDGTWGFAASPTLTADEAGRVTASAVDIARANARLQRRKITLAPADKVEATWKSTFVRDPFDVSLDEKIQFLLKLNAAALAGKGASFVSSSMLWASEEKFLATSDGSRIEQYAIRAQPGFTVTAVDTKTGDFQTRSSLAGPRTAGYEFMTEHPWIQEAQQAGEEAAQKLPARPVQPGQYDLVLDPSHLWLTIHESIGHSTELDRALGWEANYAGTSFLTPDSIGKVRIGSPIVNFVADRTQAAALATVGYDDEGVPGQRWYLVKDGMFVDWQTTRELATLIGKQRSYGCLHAASWESVPFPRMPNVSLEPAAQQASLEELVAGVERGILIQGDGSYSIDQQRYNFQFGGQTFREIVKGKVGGMLRDVAYQSRTTDFWGACDRLGGPDTYKLGGAFTDGKGEPGQSSRVSHGCPVARFRGIPVLNTRA